MVRLLQKNKDMSHFRVHSQMTPANLHEFSPGILASSLPKPHLTANSPTQLAPWEIS